MVAFAADSFEVVFEVEWPLDRSLAGGREVLVNLVVEPEFIIAIRLKFIAAIKSTKLIYTLVAALDSDVFTAMVIVAIILEAITATT